MKVAVLYDLHPRSRRIAEALKAGAERMGWQVEVTDDQHLEPRADMVMAYGWRHRLTFEAYRSKGLNYFYVDLGYWGRKHSGGDYNGYHKVVLNARNPTAYFRRPRPHDRVAGAPEVMPWKSGGTFIVVAGMSAKGAISTGRRPMEWEHKIIGDLRKLYKCPLVYRPKPSWKQAHQIAGTRFSSGAESINEAMEGAWALVTCYSNAAIDALAAGLPIWAEEGVSTALSVKSIAGLRDARPIPEAERISWLAQVGYTHFTRPEIANGHMFQQFRADGMIP